MPGFFKTSAVVIAKNEEVHIDACISSILSQTLPADEIIVVVHNSTDATFQKAKQHPVRGIELNAEGGIVSARKFGLRQAAGDIVICIDGDSYASKNWIEVLVSAITIDDAVLTGTWVRFKGTFLGTLSNFSNSIFSNRRGFSAAEMVWGPSMAFWKKDVPSIIAMLEESVSLSKELHLSRVPDDYWLALRMSERGTIVVSNRAHVTVHTKETSSLLFWKRTRENMKNAKALLAYFRKNKKCGIS